MNFNLSSIVFTFALSSTLNADVQLHRLDLLCVQVCCVRLLESRAPLAPSLHCTPRQVAKTINKKLEDVFLINRKECSARQHKKERARASFGHFSKLIEAPHVEAILEENEKNINRLESIRSMYVYLLFPLKKKIYNINISNSS